VPTIVEEGLADEAFIRERAENYAALKELVARYTLEKVALVTRIAAETIRDDARLYAASDRSMIFWGMGISSQHIHGTDKRAQPDLTGTVDQTDRPAGHRPASAARPKQPTAGIRCQAHSDVVPRLRTRR
jgi:formate dehydrogenase major subunit